MKKMNSCFKKIELLVPVFFGCLGALVFSAALSTQWLGHWADEQYSAVAATQEIVHEMAEESAVALENVYFFARPESERRDLIQEMYRDPQTRDGVVAFLTEVCGSAEIASAILTQADSHDIPPALAVALAWEESRLNPRAVNSKNRDGSIDRGLFQLNNRSFPRLDTPAFFNLELNAKYGMSHLRHCLDTGGSEVSALAMYNAGTGRVRSAGTPKTTLDYLSRILENRRKIEERFAERAVQLHEEEPEVVPVEIAEVKPERSRLVPLKPLAGR